MLRFNVLICVAALMLGCNPSPPGGTASRWELEESPGPPITITQWMESNAEASDEPLAVVLKGVVYAGEQSPFQDGTAAFLLADIPDEEYAQGGLEHVSTCPFCRRRAEKGTKALVKFLDRDGLTIRTDSRELLGIKLGDQVTVIGDATYNEELNLIVVNASNFYRPS